ncbi:MAG: hypothetical protein KatS3mg110_4209 [Pirellulaceae bacterium]|nr:MAG: hypothetical protein KatS3mg110_4209 [Pirellulaceae bacterium]
MKRHQYGGRRADLLLELLVALSLLGAVLGLVGSWSIQVRRMERLSLAELRALMAAENALELLSAMPWDSLHPEPASRYLAHRLPAWDVSQVHVSVVTDQSAPGVKRIDVSVPVDAPGTGDAVIRLSAWRCAR